MLLLVLEKIYLLKKAAENLDLEVKSMGELLTDEECVVAPAIGTAIMMNEYLENECFKNI